MHGTTHLCSSNTVLDVPDGNVGLNVAPLRSLMQVPMADDTDKVAVLRQEAEFSNESPEQLHPCSTADALEGQSSADTQQGAGHAMSTSNLHKECPVVHAPPPSFDIAYPVRHATPRSFDRAYPIRHSTLRSVDRPRQTQFSFDLIRMLAPLEETTAQESGEGELENRIELGGIEHAGSMIQCTDEPGASILLGTTGASSKSILRSGDVSEQDRDASMTQFSAQDSDASKDWSYVLSRIRWASAYRNFKQKVHPVQFPIRSMLSHFTASARFQRVCSTMQSPTLPTWQRTIT
jgi:hypothetical protein